MLDKVTQETTSQDSRKCTITKEKNDENSDKNIPQKLRTSLLKSIEEFSCQKEETKVPSKPNTPAKKQNPPKRRMKKKIEPKEAHKPKNCKKGRSKSCHQNPITTKLPQKKRRGNSQLRRKVKGMVSKLLSKEHPVILLQKCGKPEPLVPFFFHYFGAKEPERPLE
ncbi:unnamed protein product [Moneuplotes crassus]|uniref:Uncharacterized protein n=1 Tax=Euplotes crassus TaxID=5936 RepID=A0AAD1U821_EUPCR|nr:unnamed protein product [Moneuplotes crassus]